MLAVNSCIDRQFADLPALLQAGDLLVFNDTRVIKARLFGQKESGGQSRGDDRAHRRRHPRRRADPRQQVAQAGHQVKLADAFEVIVTGRAGANSRVLCPGDLDGNGLCALIEQHGQLPLPPYIAHAADGADEDALPDGLCPRTGRRRRADRRPAFRRGPAGALRAQASNIACADPARRRRHLPAGARARPRRAPHAPRALRDSASHRRRHRRAPARAAAASSPSARPACARWNRRRR